MFPEHTWTTARMLSEHSWKFRTAFSYYAGNVIVSMRVQGTCVQQATRVQRTLATFKCVQRTRLNGFQACSVNLLHSMKHFTRRRLKLKKLNITIPKDEKNLKVISIHTENTNLISKMIKMAKNSCQSPFTESVIRYKCAVTEQAREVLYRQV